MAALECKALLAGKPQRIILTFRRAMAMAAVLLIAVSAWLVLSHSGGGVTSPGGQGLVSVKIDRGEGGTGGKVEVALGGNDARPSDTDVAIDVDQVSDDEFPLAADIPDQDEWDAPTGTVMMTGVSPKADPAAANNLSDMLMD